MQLIPVIANKEFMQEYYNKRFEYRDGVLYWKTPNSNRLKVGDPAGYIDGRGYLRTNFDGSMKANHIIIWTMHFGEPDPELCLDHIDRDKLNNKLENLREITRTQNNLNSDTRILARGTSYDKTRNKWKAQISFENKNTLIGRYDTEQEAHEAYLAVYKELHDNFE